MYILFQNKLNKAHIFNLIDDKIQKFNIYLNINQFRFIQ